MKSEIILKFKEVSRFSEPHNFCRMIGIRFIWSDNKKLLYMQPITTRGTNDFRWLSVSKGDLKKFIRTLKQLDSPIAKSKSKF